MKVEKGKKGYLNAQKKKYLLYTIVEFAIVISVFVLGYMQTGSRLNLMTVVAVIGCLPASKMLVEFIVMAPHKSIEQCKYKEIEEKAPLITKVYDLLVSGEDKLMKIDAVVISGHTICGFTSSEKTDESLAAKYIKEMLANNKCEKTTVKIFHDYKAFLTRAEGMNSIADVQQADNSRIERKIKKHLLSTCM